MQVRVALCQLMPEPGDPMKNAETVAGYLESGNADVYVFPEMFLTGYGTAHGSLVEGCRDGLELISGTCRETDTAAAVGAPHFTDAGTYNGLAFMSPDGDVWYDKTHLARFGIYSEDGFLEGNGPAMGSYHGMRFGLSICYDVFFPEILHGYSLNGSAVNICIAASAVPSKPYFDRILPARALEDVTYLAFVNNTGPLADLEMHGHSRGFDPFGEETALCGTGECISVLTADTGELDAARRVRRHLEDFRRDVKWL